MTDAEIDAVYDRLDDLLLAGRFADCDAEIAKVDGATAEVDLVLSVLCVTLGAAGRLPARKRLLQQANDRGIRQLFTGLEGVTHSNDDEWVPSNRQQNRESLMRRVRMWP